MAEGGEALNQCSEIVQVDESGEVSEMATESEVNPSVNLGEKDEEAMERFLQRARSDRMYELRRIQHGDRPVTGQESRNTINNFFSKRITAQEQVAGSGKDNVPSNMDNVEEHRPEAVVVEIQGLSQSQPVSSVLQSAHFRRHLENIIRGSISSVTRTRSRNVTPVVSQAPSPRQSSPAVNLERRASQSSVNSHNSSSSSSTSESGSGQQSGSTETVPHVPEVPVAPPVPASEESSEQRPLTWNEISEIQQETIVEEISELVHRRLVSETLEGEFRNVLEIHVQNRLDATGTDGRRVQEFVQSIPQTHGVIRNDYSNLGIPGGDNWDNVSITSVSAAAVPYTQTNLHVSREIQSLKAQVEEMKSMLRVSFDLQLDIQRAIRQEVAAAVTQATGGAEGGKTVSSTARSLPINDTHCLICLDSFSDCVLYQCGHMCVCYACGRHLMSRNAKCPICRAPIKDVIRAYRCNED